MRMNPAARVGRDRTSAPRSTLHAFAAGRWSTIFPLAMFCLACKALVQRDHLNGLSAVGEVFCALALAVWLATLTVLRVHERPPC